MLKQFTRSFPVLLPILGSTLLASCSKPPAQTTVVNVKVPAATAAPDEKETDAGTVADEAEKPTAEIEPSGEPAASDKAEKAPAKTSAPSQNQSKLLDYYDRIPPAEFNLFGNVKRRDLLGRKGVTVDYKRNFIEIPGPGFESRRFDNVRLWQMTIFPRGDDPYIAVSQIVWPLGSQDGTLNFYKKYPGERDLVATSDNFLPYKLGQTGDSAHESAYLPRRGLDVIISAAEAGPVKDEMEGEGNPIFRYSSKTPAGQSPFTRLREAE